MEIINENKTISYYKPYVLVNFLWSNTRNLMKYILFYISVQSQLAPGHDGTVERKRQYKDAHDMPDRNQRVKREAEKGDTLFQVTSEVTHFFCPGSIP